MDEKKKLGEILLEAGVIDKFQLKSALAEQNKWGGRLGNHLVQMGILTEELLVKALSKQLKIPYLDLGQMAITKDVLDLVPQELAEKFHLVPVAVKKIANKKTLIVAMSDPTNLDAIDELQFRTGHIIKPAVDGDTAIEMAIRKYYYGESGPVHKPGQPIAFDPGASSGAPAKTNVPTPDVHSPPEETFSFADEATVPEPSAVPEASLADLGAEIPPPVAPPPPVAQPSSGVPAQYTDPMAYAEALEAAAPPPLQTWSEPLAPEPEPAAWTEPAPVEAAPAYEAAPEYAEVAPQMDANGQAVQYDANGQPVYAEAAPQYDANGQPIQYDANGQPVYAEAAPQYDANGQPIQYDANGQPAYAEAAPQYDANGQPIQYDANGQPIYAEATQYDAPPPEAPAADANGQAYAEAAPQYDANGQPMYAEAAPEYTAPIADENPPAWEAPAAEAPAWDAAQPYDAQVAEPTVPDAMMDPSGIAAPEMAPADGAPAWSDAPPMEAAAPDVEPAPVLADPVPEAAPDAPPAWSAEAPVETPSWTDTTQPDAIVAPVAEVATMAPEPSIEPNAAAYSPPLPPGPAEAAVAAAETVPDWRAGDAVRTDFGQHPEQPFEPTAPGEPTHAGEEIAPPAEFAAAADGGAAEAHPVEAPQWDPTASTQPDAVVEAPAPEAIAPMEAEPVPMEAEPQPVEAAAPMEAAPAETAPADEDPLALVPYETLEGRAIRAIAGLMIEKGLLTAEEVAARLKLFMGGDGGETQQ